MTNPADGGAAYPEMEVKLCKNCKNFVPPIGCAKHAGIDPVDGSRILDTAEMMRKGGERRLPRFGDYFCLPEAIHFEPKPPRVTLAERIAALFQAGFK